MSTGKLAKSKKSAQKSLPNHAHQRDTSILFFLKLIIYVLVVIVLPPVAIGYVLYKLYKKYGGAMNAEDNSSKQT